MLKNAGGVVVPSRGARARGKTGRSVWRACDMVGSGATIYTRSVLEDGCLADPGLFSAGVDIDVSWAMLQAGYCSLLCDPPASQHFHKDVSSPEYDAVRYAVKHRMAAARRFERKWGLGVRFA